MTLKAIASMLGMVRSFLTGVTRRDLERIKSIVRHTFPTAPQVGTEALAQWMGAADPSLLLVDVRSPEEFAVSHLSGAVNLQTADQIERALAERNPSRTILYCSVGFRSSRLAQELARRGRPGVASLEGSIFQWANEERPLYRGADPVRQVHPHGRRWAGLLNEGLAAEG